MATAGIGTAAEATAGDPGPGDLGPGSDMIQLVLTFVPIYTIVLTVILALATRGHVRWTILVAVPLLGAGLSWMALPLAGGNGNMLAVLLVMLLSIGLFLYYPILLVTAISIWTRRQP